MRAQAPGPHDATDDGRDTGKAARGVHADDAVYELRADDRLTLFQPDRIVVLEIETRQPGNQSIDWQERGIAGRFGTLLQIVQRDRVGERKSPAAGA